MWFHLLLCDIGISLVYTGLGMQVEETIVRPYSVTSFEGVEKFYLQLRNRRIHSSSDSVWRICEKIFYVNPIKFFQKPNKTLIDPRAVRKILKKRYRNIFEDMFVEHVKEKKSIKLFGKKISLPSLRGKKYQYLNESKLREISIDAEKYHERVFSCLVRDKRSKAIEQYFVSENEYDVNEAPSENIISGRFLFHRCNEDKLMVLAVAEEYTAMNDVPVRVEELYVSRRETRSPTRSSEDDPICKLDRGRKLRLCRTVLMKLWSQWRCEVSVELKCVKRRITIEFHAATKVYEEWMIGCQPIGSDSLKWTAQYVSRGYDNNDVFVHEVRAGRLCVSRFGSKIAVISDPSNI